MEFFKNKKQQIFLCIIILVVYATFSYLFQIKMDAIVNNLEQKTNLLKSELKQLKLQEESIENLKKQVKDLQVKNNP